MDKRADALLSRLLKNWVNRQRLPDNARARLLWEAAQISHSKGNKTSFLFRSKNEAYQSSYSNNWPQTLFTWIDINSFRFALPARLS